jgi:hypothetical protein
MLCIVISFLGATMNTLELVTPAKLSATGRATEIVSILVAALLRTQIDESVDLDPLIGDKHPKKRAIPLGFLPEQSVHTNR